MGGLVNALASGPRVREERQARLAEELRAQLLTEREADPQTGINRALDLTELAGRQQALRQQEALGPGLVPQQQAQLGLTEAQTVRTTAESQLLNVQRQALTSQPTATPFEQMFSQFAEQVPSGFVPVNLGDEQQPELRAMPIPGGPADVVGRKELESLLTIRDIFGGLLRLFEETGIEALGANVGTLNLLRGRVLAAEAQAQELGTLQPGDLPRLEQMIPRLTGVGFQSVMSRDRTIAPYREAARLLDRKIEAITSTNGSLWWLTAPPKTGALPTGFEAGLPPQAPAVPVRGNAPTTTPFSGAF